MKLSTYTEFRRKLSSMMDAVAKDHEPVVITRGQGKPAAVLMSLEDYASLEETRYLLASPANAGRLRAALADMDAGKARERELAG